MWDSNAPLQLLKTMPSKLTRENLAKLQLLIEMDKYKSSLISGIDNCGYYAPFCCGCDKTNPYPCAVAYVNMKKAEGMQIEIEQINSADVKSEPVSCSTAVAAEVSSANGAANGAAQSVAAEENAQNCAVQSVEAAAVIEAAVAEEPDTEEECVQELIGGDASRTAEEQKTDCSEAVCPVEEKHRIRIAVARRKL